MTLNISEVKFGLQEGDHLKTKAVQIEEPLDHPADEYLYSIKCGLL